MGLVLSLAPDRVDLSGRIPTDADTAFLRLALPAVALFVLGRFATTAVVLWARRRSLIARRTVIVGGGVRAAELATLLRRYPRYGLEVVGFVDDGDQCVAAAVARHLGAVADLDPVVAAYGADVLLVADGDFAERDLLDVVRTPACASLRPAGGPPDAAPSRPGPGRPTTSARSRSCGSARRTSRGAAWTVKRAFDVVVAGPRSDWSCSPRVIAACALAVRLEGGPGVIFRQPRVGATGGSSTA